jgi:aerobic carbon-monoxide dehydrogenase medium subunit
VKAPAFDYVRPATLSEAVATLSEAVASGREPQLMAGGQSLLAMMNLRVAAPGLVIDISRLEELRAVQEANGVIRFGACVTHAAIEDGRVPDPSAGLMRKVAGGFAYRAVRTRGTIGGSLALSDPAGDWVTVVPALDAQIALVGPAGRRSVAAADFATGIYETARRPDEILESVSIPKLSAQGRCGIAKFSRKTGEFALSLAAAVCDPARDYARIVLGGVQGAPIRLALAGDALRRRASLERVRQAAAEDLRGSGHPFDAYQLGLHEAMITRAVTQVLA